jgi:hypothetical protein
VPGAPERHGCARRRDETAVADIGLRCAHRHELVVVDEPKNHPHGTRHGTTSRVAETSRLNEVDQSASSLDVALRGGLDVPDPVDIGTVRHDEDIVVIPPQGITGVR